MREEIRGKKTTVEDEIIRGFGDPGVMVLRSDGASSAEPSKRTRVM
jgi:hypothetical protein